MLRSVKGATTVSSGLGSGKTTRGLFPPGAAEAAPAGPARRDGTRSSTSPSAPADSPRLRFDTRVGATSSWAGIRSQPPAPASLPVQPLTCAGAEARRRGGGCGAEPPRAPPAGGSEERLSHSGLHGAPECAPSAPPTVAAASCRPRAASLARLVAMRRSRCSSYALGPADMVGDSVLRLIEEDAYFAIRTTYEKKCSRYRRKICCGSDKLSTTHSSHRAQLAIQSSGGAANKQASGQGKARYPGSLQSCGSGLLVLSFTESIRGIDFVQSS